MEDILGKFEVKGWGGDIYEVEAQRTKYPAGGAPAVVLLDPKDGSRSGTLSVNMPGVQLADDEFCVKTWSENEIYREPALKSGLFEDTGRRTPAGYAEAEIWRFVG